MPRPTFPPTPASSTEIKGKDGSRYSSLHMSFELPPPAVAGMESPPTSSSTKTSSASASASSYQPASPSSPSPAILASEAVKLRRRPATQATTKESFALPPPPTRSRKIIQMKPRGRADETMSTSVENTKSSGRPTPNASKRKEPSSTSVAGRKIARKTAHSLIERRRRSKMNEEFGVLKDMIPACTGEMHKLAILQVSHWLIVQVAFKHWYIIGVHRLCSLPRRLCLQTESREFSRQLSHNHHRIQLTALRSPR